MKKMENETKNERQNARKIKLEMQRKIKEK